MSPAVLSDTPPPEPYHLTQNALERFESFWPHLRDAEETEPSMGLRRRITKALADDRVTPAMEGETPVWLLDISQQVRAHAVVKPADRRATERYPWAVVTVVDGEMHDRSWRMGLWRKPSEEKPRARIQRASQKPLPPVERVPRLAPAPVSVEDFQPETVLGPVATQDAVRVTLPDMPVKVRLVPDASAPEATTPQREAPEDGERFLLAWDGEGEGGATVYHEHSRQEVARELELAHTDGRMPRVFREVVVTVRTVLDF